MDDQEINFVKLPEVPLSAFQMMEKVHQYTSELSKLGTLGGQPQRGVESATEADLNIRNAAVKLAGCVSSLRACVAIARSAEEIEHLWRFVSSFVQELNSPPSVCCCEILPRSKRKDKGTEASRHHSSSARATKHSHATFCNPLHTCFKQGHFFQSIHKQIISVYVATPLPF